jgi:hypothetical protein
MARKTKRKTKKADPGSRAATVTWAAGHMKANPDITMAELKKLGAAAGHHVYPLILGLALKELGLSGRARRPASRKAAKKTGKRGPGRPPGSRGPGRPPGRRGPGRPPGRRGPGRPPKQMDPAAAISSVLTRMRDLERERDALRKALGRVQDIVGKM